MPKMKEIMSIEKSISSLERVGLSTNTPEELRSKLEDAKTRLAVQASDLATSVTAMTAPAGAEAQQTCHTQVAASLQG